MAPSTIALELDAPCDWPHAARSAARAITNASRRSTNASLRGGRGPEVHAQAGQLLPQLRRRRVPVVDVDRLAVRAHHDRGRKHVDVEPLGELPLRDGVDPIDAHARQLGERRFLVRLADSAALAGEVEDVRLARNATAREQRDAAGTERA